MTSFLYIFFWLLDKSVKKGYNLFILSYLFCGVQLLAGDRRIGLQVLLTFCFTEIFWLSSPLR